MAILPDQTETGAAAAETKADVFKRLAGARLAKVLDAMDTLSNCANKSQYDYTPEQVAKIRQHLETKLAFVMNAFERTDKKQSGRTIEL